MSKGGQIAIGVTFLIGGVCMAACGFFVGNEVPAGPTPFYLGGAFCIVVATACLVRRSRSVASILPLIIAGVLGYCFRNGPPKLALEDFSGLALAAGILFFVILGCYLLFRWKYRVSIRAVRMAQAGDIEGGIALLPRTPANCWGVSVDLQRPCGSARHQLGVGRVTSHDREGGAVGRRVCPCPSPTKGWCSGNSDGPRRQLPL